MGYPLLLITALILLGILLTNLVSWSSSILYHSSSNAVKKLFLFVNVESYFLILFLILFSKIFHKFSIGLRSGLWAGQGRISIKLSSSQDLVLMF